MAKSPKVERPVAVVAAFVEVPEVVTADHDEPLYKRTA